MGATHFRLSGARHFKIQRLIHHHHHQCQFIIGTSVNRKSKSNLMGLVRAYNATQSQGNMHRSHSAVIVLQVEQPTAGFCDFHQRGSFCKITSHARNARREDTSPTRSSSDIGEHSEMTSMDRPMEYTSSVIRLSSQFRHMTKISSDALDQRNSKVATRTDELHILSERSSSCNDYLARHIAM